MTLQAVDHEMLVIFLDESRERLANFQKGMLALEANPREADKEELVNAMFREMHTIKGGARYLDCKPISELCHAAEEYLDDLRNGNVRLSTTLTSALLAAADRLGESFAFLDRKEDVPPGFTADLIAELMRLSGASQPTPALDTGIGEDAVILALVSTVREQSEIIRNALDELADPGAGSGARNRIGKASEILKNSCEYAHNPEALALAQSLNLALTSVSAGPGSVVEKTRILSELDRLGRSAKPNTKAIQKQKADPAGDGRKNESDRSASDAASRSSNDNAGHATSLRVDQTKIDRGISLAGELSIMRASLRHAARQISRDPTNLAPLFETADVLDRVSTEIEEHALGLRRVAMRQCFGRFPRVIRDLSLALAKEINLVVEGDGIEVDKTVVEALAEPLVHVLRNACDHGLEMSDDRERAGKSRIGTVHVRAAYEGKQVVIEIGDDGRGIQVEHVVAKAVKLGLITAEAAQRKTTDELTQLILLPGLSTADKITDVSGRGVGMDVVKRTVDDLGGQIHITTKIGTGTTFRIVLPPASFAQSFTSSVLVNVGNAIYALPMEAVTETVKVPLDDIRLLGDHPAICIRGDIVPIRPLAELLKTIDPSGSISKGREGLRGLVHEGQIAIAILATPQGLLGLAVDKLIGQQGLVVKPLPVLLGALPGIAGASIQADGGILLMIDAASIIHAAVNRDANGVPGTPCAVSEFPAIDPPQPSSHKEVQR